MNSLQMTCRAITIILLLCAVSAVDARESESINWLGFDTAQKQGNPDGKKYFIYFFSQNCGYCRKLEQNALSNKDIMGYLNQHFVPVRVNTDQEPKLAQRYRVQGVPDLRFVSADGQDIARWPGYTEADHLLALLKFVHTDSYKQMNFGEFIKSMNQMN
jgi:thioredoxin-related protein